MSGTTRVVLVRHGQTEWNGGARFQGHLDSPLTAQGIAQSQQLGARLRRDQIAAIYSSDLGRAHHTAKLIADGLNLPIRLEPGLRERCMGIFQGLARCEIAERFPLEHDRYYSGDPDYSVPEGQSARGHFENALACLNEIASRHPEQTIAVVTHGGVLSGLFRHAVGIDFRTKRRYSIVNSGYNKLAWHPPGEWIIETWGDTSHFDAQ